MITKFKDTIATLNSSNNLEIVAETFVDEIIFNEDLSMSVFWDLKFENFTLEKAVMRKSEFTDCTFKNCNLINSSFSKVEFDENIFTNCQFVKVNLGWSAFFDCTFKKTKFEQVDFEGATLSNLKIKDLIVLNLNFTETFPTKFYKSNSNEFIEVKSQSNFEKILKDMLLRDSTD